MALSGHYEPVGLQQELEDFGQFEDFCASLTLGDEDTVHGSSREDRCGNRFWRLQATLQFEHDAQPHADGIPVLANLLLEDVLMVARACLKHCDYLGLENQLLLSALHAQAQKLPGR